MIKRNSHSFSSGFTLLEIAIVIIVSAILTFVIITLLQNYQLGLRHEQAKAAIRNATNTLNQFYVNYRRYPCPADPTLPETDANFGAENCALATVAGQRPDLTGETVMIGTFPIYANVTDTSGNPVREYFSLEDGYIKSTEFSNVNFKDPWQNRLTYGVTTALTSTSTFDPTVGAIKVIDEFGRNTGGIVNDAHYALVSHGQDGRGAIGVDGTARLACDTLYANEAENCDGDSVFRQSIMRKDETTAVTRLIYYDDYLGFYKFSPSNLWGRITNGITNLNNGMVGIKNQAPQSMLDVRGAMLVQSNTFQRNICSPATPNAFTTGTHTAPPTTRVYFDNPASATPNPAAPAVPEICFAPGSIYDITRLNATGGASPCPAGQFLTGVKLTMTTSPSFGGHKWVFDKTGCAPFILIKPPATAPVSSTICSPPVTPPSAPYYPKGYLRGVWSKAGVWSNNKSTICWTP